MTLRLRCRRKNVWRFDPSQEMKLMPNSENVQSLKEMLSGHLVKDVVCPGHPEAKSGSFLTICLNDGNYVVLTRHRNAKNRGQQHENAVEEEFSNFAMTQELSQERHPNIVAICKSSPRFEKAMLGYKSFQRAGDINTRPAMSTDLVLEDIGQVISDISVDTEDGIFHISVKGARGDTIANLGINNRTPLMRGHMDGSIVSKTHTYSHILKAFGVEPKIHAAMLGLYKDIQIRQDTKERNPFEYDKNVVDSNVTCEILKCDFPTEPDREKIRNVIANSVGYGYIYARQKKNGFFVYDLQTPEDTLKLLGDVCSVKVSYPGYQSKQTTITATLSSGMKFVGEIRSSHGQLYPTEFKMKLFFPQ